MKLDETNYNGQRWVNITQPDQEMVEYLKQNFPFHPLDLEDLLSKTQYPKVDVYEDYLFIVLQFPIYEKTRRLFTRSELNVFFSKDYLITINSGELHALQNFFRTVKVGDEARKKFMRAGTALLLYEIIDALLGYVFPMINEKNEQIFRLEEEIFEIPTVKDMIQEVMILKRNMINLRRILAPQRAVLVELETKHRKIIPEELSVYFGDLVDKKDKIMSQLEAATAYITVLEEANESIITRNTNRIIRLLTIFTVIMLPLTLITSYYGMNVRLPLQNDPHAVTYINITLILLLLTMLGYFVKKRLF